MVGLSRRFLGAAFALLVAVTLSHGSFAAIAFVTATDLGNNGGATNSLTAACTVGSGANRELDVEVTGDSAGGNDDITGVTYNAVSMTLVAKKVGTGDRNIYLYHLEGPASGSNNVVVSATNTHYLLVGCDDYTGVNSSGQPDASSTDNQTGTNLTTTVTTVSDNDWAVLLSETLGSASTAGTGLTKRSNDGAFNTWMLFDSGGAITPAQTYSMTVNNTASRSTNFVVGAFKPVGAAAACPKTLALMGVGC